MFSKVLCTAALLASVSLAAQTSSPSGASPSQTGPARRGGTPCWQQAGIEKSVMEQRWSIERDTRSQIEAVCSNSSLTPQQKHQQTRDLRQQARQKMEGLVTPEQEKALTACQEQRGFSHPGGAGMQGGCGEGHGNGQHPNGGNTNPPPSSPQN